MKKDYWNICRRNFNAMAVLSAIVFLLLMSKASLIMTLSLLIEVVVYFVLARMYKKHSTIAIAASYVILGLFVVIMIVNNVLHHSSFVIQMVLAYLIYAYLIQCVYMAQKQKVLK